MNNKLSTISKETKWSGGITKELDISKDGNFENRNFAWRLSSAAVEKKESQFTKFEGYNRILMIIDGSMELNVGGKTSILNTFDQMFFDGNENTSSLSKTEGKIIDYNLIFKKGSKASLEVLDLHMEKNNIASSLENYQLGSESFFVVDGYCLITQKDKRILLEKGNIYTINYNENEKFEIEIVGEGKLIHSKVFFNDANANETETNNRKGKKPPITKDDFMAASVISLQSIRGSRKIFRGIRDIWFDHDVREAIEKVDRFYLTFFVMIVGMMLTIVPIIELGLDGLVFPALILWVFLDIFLVTPFVFLMFLPRPVMNHMRRFSEMDEYEKAVAIEEMSENARMKRLLKKYKFTGRNTPKE